MPLQSKILPRLCKDPVSSEIDFFSTQPIDLNASPISPAMDGWDCETKGPMPLLFTPFIRDVISIDTVNQELTVQLDTTVDWIDDGLLRVSDATVGSSEDNKYRSDVPNWQAQAAAKGAGKAAADGYVAAVPIPSIEAPVGASATYGMKDDDQNTDRDAIFRPQLIFSNISEQVNDRYESVLVAHIAGRPVVQEYFSQIVKVRCPFDLREFPFDVQHLNIDLCSNWWTADMVKYVIDQGRDEEDCTRKHIDLDYMGVMMQDYKVLGVYFEQHDRKYAYFDHYSDQSSVYTVLSYVLVVQRLPHFYIYKLVLVLLMLVLLKAVTVFLPLEDYSVRLGWDGAILFTTVGFNYIVSSMLPCTGYLTRMDKWLFCLNTCLVIGILIDVLLCSGYSRQTLELDDLGKMDNALAISYCGIVTLASAWFLLPFRGFLRTHRELLRRRSFTRTRGTRVQK